MSFFKDGEEKSMRRLVAFWAMCLLTILIFGIMFKAIIDTQIFFIIGSIVTVAIGSAAIKNKSGMGKGEPPKM